MKNLLIILAVFLISLFTLEPAFHLGLFGDDWLAFWKYNQSLGPGSEYRHWNHFSYFLTSYGAQDITMNFLRNIFGYNSTYYQLISYLFRLMAAFSLFPIVFYLTKSKFAAFFAMLFFSVTTIGFDTTNWVFNMPSYIGIAFFNLFLFFFLKSREEKGYRSLFFAGLFYYLAYITAPIRFTGILTFVIVIELFWLMMKRNKQTAKRVALRLLFIFFIMIFISRTGTSLGSPNDWRERGIGGITMAFTMLSSGRFDFIFYPLTTFGGMLIPIILMPISKQFILKSDLFFSLIPIYLLFLIVINVITKDLPNRGKNFIWINSLLGILWLFGVIGIFITNRLSFSNGSFIFQLAIGGYTLIISAYIFIKSYEKPLLFHGLFVSIAWSILSFLLAWGWSPNTIFPTYHRYLAGAAAGVAILLAILLSLAKKINTKYLTGVVFLVILITHIVSTRIYIKTNVELHGKEISEKIWSKIPYVPEVIKDPGPKIFYFEGDGTNAGILQDVIIFGFPPHMQILYHMREEEGLAPTPMTDWKEVEAAAIDGRPFHRYNYFKPLPLDRIFAFRLEGKDNLINITEIARKKLTDIIANQNSK